MKSTVVYVPEKGKVVLQEINIADPGENEIQVRFHASVMSPGTERAIILNIENAGGNYPRYSGYSSAGVVEKTGSKVTGFSEGDRAACSFLGHRSLGNIDENRAIRIPEGVSFEEAAFLTLGVICLQGVRKARIEIGESVMVLGLGLIGQIALQLSAINGASPVAGVDRIEKRLRIAERCGADFTFNSVEEGWMEKLRECTGGKGPQVVFESTGYPEAVSSALESVRRFGRIILLGSSRGNSTVNFYRDVHKKGSTIIGAHVFTTPRSDSYPGCWTWEEEAACFMQLLRKKRISFGPIITDRIGYEKIEETYKRLLSWDNDMVGTVIKWQ